MSSLSGLGIESLESCCCLQILVQIQAPKTAAYYIIEGPNFEQPVMKFVYVIGADVMTLL